MTEKGLMSLNKISLVRMIERLQKENRLLRKDIIYTCMECDKQFDLEQVNIIDDNGNVLCPYCNCSDIRKEIINE